MKIRMYTDGGARGNPGPAGTGIVFLEVDEAGNEGKVIAEFGSYLGRATNNQAEYQAIVEGLTKAKELGYQEVEARLDSQLAVRQLNGEYKVKNPELAKKVLQIHNLRTAFKKVSFSHVRRENNTLADAMVNKAIDEALAN